MLIRDSSGLVNVGITPWPPVTIECYPTFCNGRERKWYQLSSLHQQKYWDDTFLELTAAFITDIHDKVFGTNWDEVETTAFMPVLNS